MLGQAHAFGASFQDEPACWSLLKP
jgi:hypothetical protein